MNINISYLSFLATRNGYGTSKKLFLTYFSILMNAQWILDIFSNCNFNKINNFITTSILNMFMFMFVVKKLSDRLTEWWHYQWVFVVMKKELFDLSYVNKCWQQIWTWQHESNTILTVKRHLLYQNDIWRYALISNQHVVHVFAKCLNTATKMD